MYLVWYKPDHEYSDNYTKMEAKDWGEAQEIKNKLIKYYDNIYYTVKLDIFFTGPPLDFPPVDQEDKEKNSSYYFYAFMDDEIDDDIYTGTYYIVDKNYWRAEHCLDDRTIQVDVPEGFCQCCESEFEYEGSLEEGIAKLKDAGFVWNPEMEILT